MITALIIVAAYVFVVSPIVAGAFCIFLKKTNRKHDLEVADHFTHELGIDPADALELLETTSA